MRAITTLLNHQLSRRSGAMIVAFGHRAVTQDGSDLLLARTTADRTRRPTRCL
jgi:hypothetical protein